MNVNYSNIFSYYPFISISLDYQYCCYIAKNLFQLKNNIPNQFSKGRLISDCYVPDYSPYEMRRKFNLPELYQNVTIRK